uniref:Uncharacterized protein n=1 Tax=Arundo donax TaxID=35708 RepID=A0A0A9C6W5_ARUDO
MQFFLLAFAYIAGAMFFGAWPCT